MVFRKKKLRDTTTSVKRRLRLQYRKPTINNASSTTVVVSKQGWCYDSALVSYTDKVTGFIPEGAIFASDPLSTHETPDPADSLRVGIQL
jgi:hypothetical protein